MAALMVAVICVALMVAVGAVNWTCEVPRVQFNVETCVGSLELLRKFVPVTVSARSLPETAQVGETEVTVGTGLGGLLMMKFRGLERPLVPVP